MQPVLACKQLQDLNSNSSSASAAELMKLSSSLPALAELSLTYRQHPAWAREVHAAGTADAAAAAWATLSNCLSSLKIIQLQSSRRNLSFAAATTLQQLRWLTGLTSLSLECCDMLPLTAPTLADIMQRLTALQQVKLSTRGPHLLLPDMAGQLSPTTSAVVMDAAGQSAAATQQSADCWPAGQGGSTPNMLPMVQAIASLSHLVDLYLVGSGLNWTSLQPLTGLKQLTRLTLGGCDVDEATRVNLVASGLAGVTFV